MQLKEFSLLSSVIESGEVLKAIETAIPSETIEEVVGNTDTREERKRSLTVDTEPRQSSTKLHRKLW